jgi:peptide/nickel transport system permease protein
MISYVLRRAMRSIPIVLLVTILVFSMIHLLPGDPVMHMFAGQYVSAENMALAREALGLDRPIYVRYFEWLWRILNGDFGVSIVSKRPVADMLLSVIPRTVELALSATVVMIAFGVSAGIAAAITKDSWLDNALMIAASLLVSMPLFWFGLIALLIFSVELGWFPIAANAGWRSLVLPAVVLGLHSACMVARLTRSSMLQVLGDDYVTTARSKGLGEPRVIAVHALRNAFIPVLTLLGVQTSWMLGGAVITETVFARPGLGTMAVEAIRQMDFPILQAVVLIAALTYTTVNLLVDLLNAVLDPRIAYESRAGA